ncbi:hypothetical protein AGOR_G00032150 [Albula goreensis]|uniref:Uncharacterized protein n=1 Tax=Albula goreensis TaxID=1534307 RepID=A0A8T3DUZ8_9TELE|nr:hypothetical protein AGOR_G00032150 [Albula goreensis]
MTSLRLYDITQSKVTSLRGRVLCAALGQAVVGRPSLSCGKRAASVQPYSASGLTVYFLLQQNKAQRNGMCSPASPRVSHTLKQRADLQKYQLSPFTQRPTPQNVGNMSQKAVFPNVNGHGFSFYKTMVVHRYITLILFIFVYTVTVTY